MRTVSEQKYIHQSRQITWLRISHAHVNSRISLAATFCDFLQFGGKQVLLW